MRKATYLDPRGRMFLVLLPDGVPDKEASHGVKVGPPIMDLGLPSTLATRLHNELFHRGLYTYQDARRRRQDVLGALQAALGLDVEHVLQAYATTHTSVGGEASQKEAANESRTVRPE